MFEISHYKYSEKKKVLRVLVCFSWLGIWLFLRFIYLFHTESTNRHSSQLREREKQALCWAGSPVWGLIPRSWNHDLSHRQKLNWLSPSGIPSWLGLRSWSQDNAIKPHIRPPTWCQVCLSLSFTLSLSLSPSAPPPHLSTQALSKINK